MVIFGIDLVLLIPALMISATPVLLAAIGEAVVEKSGVLNLGVEGMMITGAVIGFIIAVNTQVPIYGFFCAAIAGALLSVIFAVLTQYMMSNQVATGLGLTMVGLGLSALIGKPYEGIKSPTLAKIEIPILSDIPILGPMIFSHDAIVYFSIFVIALVAFVINKTRIGLVLRAVGENQEAAHALGYKVIRIRFIAIMFGGATAGIGGAYISLARVPQWTEGMTAGAGWIALALVVFASWKPWRVLVRCLSFWRHYCFTAQFTGNRRSYSSRNSFNVTISRDNSRSGRYIFIWTSHRAWLAGATFPRLTMRQNINRRFHEV